MTRASHTAVSKMVPYSYSQQTAQVLYGNPHSYMIWTVVWTVQCIVGDQHGTQYSAKWQNSLTTSLFSE